MKKRRTRAAKSKPSAESLADFPEVDFSRSVQPHRYARLQSGYRHQLFVDPEVFAHFGSVERINDALRLLVELAARPGVKTQGASKHARGRPTRAA